MLHVGSTHTSLSIHNAVWCFRMYNLRAEFDKWPHGPNRAWIWWFNDDDRCQPLDGDDDYPSEQEKKRILQSLTSAFSQSNWLKPSPDKKVFLPCGLCWLLFLVGQHWTLSGHMLAEKTHGALGNLRSLLKTTRSWFNAHSLPVREIVSNATVYSMGVEYCNLYGACLC